MTENFSDELLSACFDGEISPEERARVDAQLSADPESRRTLEECRKLSGLLKDLPTPHTPPEFCAAVMQNIERQMLLGPADAAAGSERAPIRRSFPSWRTQWAPAAASLAAAAVLVVAVLISQRQENQPEGTIAIARHDSNFDSSRPIADESLGERELMARDAGRRVALPAAPTEPAIGAPMSSAAPRSAEADPSRTRSFRSEEPSIATSESGRSTVEFQNGESRLVFGADRLQGANVGQVIEAIEHTDRGVAVVRLQVVDRMQGMLGVQSLLARNSISQEASEANADDKAIAAAPPAAAPTETSSRVTVGGGDESLPEEEELICVLVEAPPERLAEALRQFHTLEGFEELSVEEPVEIAQLDRRASEITADIKAKYGDFGAKRTPLSQFEKEGKLKAQPRSKDAQAAPTDAPSTAKGDAKPETESAEGEAAASKKESLPAKSDFGRSQKSPAQQLARQRQMNLPSQFFKADPWKNSRSNEFVPKNQSGSVVENSPVVAARPGLSNDESRQSHSQESNAAASAVQRPPVQVLFVFVDKQPAVPAEGSKRTPRVKVKARNEGDRPKSDDGAAS